MSWVTVGVAAAGLIAGKMKNDKAKAVEDSDRKLAASTQQYSPWTGLQAGSIRPADSAGADMFQGGVNGAMIGHSLSNGMQGGPAGDTMAGGPMQSQQEQNQFLSPQQQSMQQQKPRLA